MAKRIFLFIFTLLLIGTAIGMFYLQNIYLPEINAQKKTMVYISNKDLNPLTEIKEEDFTPILLPSSAISTDYVLNITEVIGSPIKNTIYEKEILAFSHIADDDIDSKKNLLTTIVPTFYDDIKPNDLVNIYVIKADKKSNIFSMETIYTAKKVEKVTSEESLTNAKQNFAFSVTVSEDELKSYYAAQHAGDIVATKIINPNLIDIVSKLTPFNPNEIVFNTENMQEQKTDNVEELNKEEVQNQ